MGAQPARSVEYSGLTQWYSIEDIWLFAGIRGQKQRQWDSQKWDALDIFSLGLVAWYIHHLAGETELFLGY
jgi:hypothetical protein